MLVKELLAALTDAPEDAPVILSIDGEGNGYKELDTVDTQWNSWIPEDGEIGLRSLDDESRLQGYTEEDVAPEGSQPCVVLWPA